jgi:tetratricopeptide (TPR) repeat protein
MRDFREVLLEDLKNPDEAKEYLKVALEEFKNDRDDDVLMMAMINIIEALSQSEDIIKLRNNDYDNDNEIEELRKYISSIIDVKSEEAIEELYCRIHKWDGPDSQQAINIFNNLSRYMKNEIFRLGRRCKLPPIIKLELGDKDGR